jgi:oxygen-independent coproporphyrinogen-3 oxidase
MECNPEDITPERVRQYVQMGITRISLGVQTLSDRALQEIHRAPASWTEHAMEALAGFPNVNLDFMLGLPHV